MVGHTPSGCFRSGGQYERRTGHPAFSGQLGHEGTNRGKDAGVCDWDDYTVINQTGKLKDGALWIIFDCGYDDFFFEVNQAFHQKLLERGVMHDFIVRPGAHTGEYWSNSIDYQILFFLKFFRASH